MQPMILSNGSLKTLVSIPGWTQKMISDSGVSSDPVTAYLASAWLYRAIEIRMNAVSTPPLCLYDKDGEKIESHEALNVLESVNAEWNKSDLWRYTEGGLNVYGAGYWQKIRVGQRVRELFYLNPSTMKPVMTRQGIQRFDQESKGQKVGEFERGDVVYFRGAYDPRSDLTGLAQVHWAIKAALAEENADKLLAHFFENGAVPPMLFATDQPVAEPDKNRFLEWVRQLFGGGVTSGVKAGVLGGGMKPYPLSSTVREMELEKVRAIVHQTISTALGVPELLISSAGANDLTPVKAAESYFWRHTVIPRLSWYCETLNAELLPDFPDLMRAGAYFEHDLTEIPALQEDISERSDRILAHLAARLVKREKAAELLGYAPEDMPEPEQPAPAVALPVPTVETQESDDETEAQKSLAALDMERWRKKALKALDAGKSPAVQFTSDYIPALEHGRIKAALTVALNESDVRAAFVTPAHDDAEIASELRRLRMEIEKR